MTANLPPLHRMGLFFNWLLRCVGLTALCLLTANCWAEGHLQEQAQVQVKQAYVDMRSGPAGAYPVVYVAAKDEWLSVLKQRTSWFKVQTAKGQLGWISQDDLHLTLSASGEPVLLSDGSFDNFASRQFEVGTMLGSFDGIPSVTVMADWISTENISLGINLTQAVGSFSDHQLAMVNIRHSAFPEWRLAPYVVFGAGKIRTKPNGSLVQSGDEARSANVLSAGLGLRYYLARHFLIKLEFNSLLVKTNRDKNEELAQWTLGFAVFF
ncbi:SH3 domain-containing protein [Paraglaciecola sp.]|uniref:SH3 domain-containing protein n=1 Tax=Paraglaciecola sp. TaxID=1920173 RepID=UPI0030F39364